MVFRTGVGSRCLLGGSIFCHKVMKSWCGFAHQAARCVTVPGGVISSVSLELVGASIVVSSSWEFGSWGTPPAQRSALCSCGRIDLPALLREPHAEQEPSVSIPFRCGGVTFPAGACAGLCVKLRAL